MSRCSCVLVSPQPFEAVDNVSVSFRMCFIALCFGVFRLVGLKIVLGKLAKVFCVLYCIDSLCRIVTIL